MTRVCPSRLRLLYGSQACGDARQEWDWDILIVLDKDRLTPEDYDTITYPLTKLGWDMGAEINPIMYTKKGMGDQPHNSVLSLKVTVLRKN